MPHRPDKTLRSHGLRPADTAGFALFALFGLVGCGGENGTGESEAQGGSSNAQSGSNSSGSAGVGGSGAGGAEVLGTRFDTTSVAWAVPSEASPSPGYDAVADVGWTTLDIDGDGRPDLVNTTEDASGTPSVWGLGSSPHWKVFRNVP